MQCLFDIPEMPEKKTDDVWIWGKDVCCGTRRNGRLKGVWKIIYKRIYFKR